MKHLQILTTVFLCAGLLAAPCAAADPLKVATLSYPPFQYEERGEAVGIAADIVKGVFERMDQPIEITFYPFVRAMDTIRSGRSDVIFTFYHKKEREAFAEYSSEPLVDQTISLFVHDDSEITFNGDLSELKPYQFGMVRFSYGKVLDEAVETGVITDIDYVTRMENNMNKFLKRRFDILPSDRWVALYYYSKVAPSGGSRIRELHPPVDTFPAYIGFTRARDLSAVKTRVDETLRKMKADGSYGAIIDGYLERWGVALD